MPYPQNVTWNLEAFALLQQMLKEGKPFTSLDFKTRLRSTAKASVRQADVSAFLQQAHLEDHMEGFEMQDNGQYRTYAPVPKVGFFTKIFTWLNNVTIGSIEKD